MVEMKMLTDAKRGTDETQRKKIKLTNERERNK